MFRRAIALAVPAALVPVALLASCAKPTVPTAEPAPAPGMSVAPSTWLVTGPPGNTLPTGAMPTYTMPASMMPSDMGTANTDAIPPSASPSALASSAQPRASVDSVPILEAAGTFLPYRPGSPTITYNPKVIPAGSTAAITISRTSYGMQVVLAANGLVPHHAYGAHLHTQPCGGVASAAGAPYQHKRDPKAGPSAMSMNPAYANPGNEIWLDFTADGAGNGTTTSKEKWTFPAAKGPRSLVLHDKPGMSGAEVACMTLS